MRLILISLLSFYLVLPSSANAEEDEVPLELIAYALTMPILNAGLASYDIWGRPVSKGYAIAEVLLTTPQVLIGGWFVVSEIASSPSFGEVGGGILYFAVPTALLIHGIYTLAGDERTKPKTVSASQRVFPMVLGSAENKSIPGIGISGVF